MDPISLIVTALAVGAAAGVRATAPAVVKDAYAGLKRVIQDKYAAIQPNVEQLEQSPESKGRRAVVEEELAKTGAASDKELLQKAQALLELVERHDPDVARTVGLDLSDFKSTELTVEGLKVQSGTRSGTGVKASGATIEGPSSFKDIEVTSGLPKSQDQ
jgi:hypothetical protein